MHYLYKIPVTVLLTQELTSLHVVSGLKTDQRPQLGLCLHSDLLTTSELPAGDDWVFCHCYLTPRELLPQCLRMNHLTTRPCEMMGPATPELGKGPWHLRGAIFWGEFGWLAAKGAAHGARTSSVVDAATSGCSPAALKGKRFFVTENKQAHVLQYRSSFKTVLKIEESLSNIYLI